MKKSLKVTLGIVTGMAVTTGAGLLYAYNLVSLEKRAGIKKNSKKSELENIKKPLKIMYIGDSITSGVYSDDKMRSNTGYRGQIDKILKDENLFDSSINFAVGGFKFDDIQKQVIEDQSFNKVNEIIRKKYPHVEEYYPPAVQDTTFKNEVRKNDVIISTIGANDILSSIKYRRGKMKVNYDSLFDAINKLNESKKSLYKELREINPNVKIIDVGIYFAFPWIDESYMKKMYPVLVFGETRMFINDRKNGIYFAKIRDNMAANLRQFIDNPRNIHPNEEGYGIIANEVLKTINEAFEKN